jgi:hypothetical protein
MRSVRTQCGDALTSCIGPNRESGASRYAAEHTWGIEMKCASTTISSTQTATGFEIRFQSLFREGCALAFPCDHEGHVDLDAIGERARNNYFFARATIGIEYALPVVKASELH